MKTGDAFSSPDVLWLIRHGDRADAHDLDWGRTAARPHDPGLSALGAAQARAAAARLAGEGISRVFTSPYLRCVETTSHIARVVNAPVSLEPGLGELQDPHWGPGLTDMLPAARLHALLPSLDPTHTPVEQPAAPETIEQAFARAARTASALSAAHRGPLLLVGHAVSVIGIVKQLAVYPGDVTCPVASLFRLAPASDRWEVTLLADTSHLGRELVRSL